MDKQTNIYAALRRGMAQGRAATSTRGAAHCLKLAREWMESDRADYPGRYDTSQIWGGMRGGNRVSDGDTQWHESPPWRYRDAHEIVRLRHTGWYIDDMQCHTVCGVVFQISAKHGESRFLAAMADPFNDGAARVDVSTVYDCERSAAYMADGMAESYAEQEREYQESWRAGRDARDAANEATQAAREFVQAVRALCDTYKARHACGRRAVRALIAAVKQSRRTMDAARETAREMRDAIQFDDVARDTYQEGI